MNKEITSLKNNSELKRELKKFRDMKNHLNNMNSSKKLSNILTPRTLENIESTKNENFTTTTNSTKKESFTERDSLKLIRDVSFGDYNNENTINKKIKTKHKENLSTDKEINNYLNNFTKSQGNQFKSFDQLFNKYNTLTKKYQESLKTIDFLKKNRTVTKKANSFHANDLDYLNNKKFGLETAKELINKYKKEANNFKCIASKYKNESEVLASEIITLRTELSRNKIEKNINKRRDSLDFSLRKNKKENIFNSEKKEINNEELLNLVKNTIQKIDIFKND